VIQIFLPIQNLFLIPALLVHRSIHEWAVYLTPPEDTGPGTYSITVRVKDNGSPVLEDWETITITVTEGNAAPVLVSIGSKTVDEGSLLSFTATATDSDIPTNSLVFSLDAGSPNGSSIDPTTGLFSWTPSEAQGPGSYNPTIRVTDNGSPARSSSERITITVKEVNQAPVLATIGDRVVDEGSQLSFTAAATDPDVPANPLTYSLDSGAPGGASINAVTGVFTWTPTEAQGPGAYPVTIRVSDNGRPAFEDWETFNITIAEVNAAPVLSAIGSKSVPEGSALTFTAIATDSDNLPSSLTFSLDAGAPAGASIHPTSGQFTWNPTEAQGPGSYQVTMRVTDDGSPDANDSEMITITVTEVNSEPVLALVSDQEIDENVGLNFTAKASDMDEPANSLLFSLDPGSPTGANIHPTSASSADTVFQGPGVYQVTLRVQDGGIPELFGSQTITITVNEVNSVPVASDDQYFLAYNSSSTTLDVLTNDSSAPDIGETLLVTEADPAVMNKCCTRRGLYTKLDTAEAIPFYDFRRYGAVIPRRSTSQLGSHINPAVMPVGSSAAE
jgi:uncharacterized protein (UPF0179 family)